MPNQRLPEGKRITMNDRSTQSQTKLYTIRNSNCYQNLHQIPTSKMLSSPSFIHNDHIYQTDEDIHSMNCGRFTSVEYIKPSQGISYGIQDSTYIDPREMNRIKQTNLDNHNQYIMNRTLTDNKQFQPSSSPSTSSLTLSLSSSSSASSSSSSSSSSATSTSSSLSTPTLSTVYTNSICPSKYVSTPLTNANILWSQEMNPFSLRNSMYTRSLKQFPKQFIQSTYPNYISHSLTSKQFQHIYHPPRPPPSPPPPPPPHHHHHHQQQQQRQQQQEQQRQQQPQQQQQQEQQRQQQQLLLLQRQSSYQPLFVSNCSLSPFNMNHNVMKYSTIPLDKTIFMKRRRRRLTTDIGVKNFNFTNSNDTTSNNNNNTMNIVYGTTDTTTNTTDT
ncbi:unnamed protein product, partial [Schistosoma mattheei]